MAKRNSKRRKKKNNWKLTVILFLSLIVLIFIFGFSVIQKSNEKAKEKREAELAVEQEQELEQEQEIEIEIEDPEQYTFKDMETTMYAVDSSVEVRDQADNDGELIGTLSLNQIISVVGQCEQTNYYKIKINGDYGYVAEDGLSADYIDIPLPISGEVVVPSTTKDILFIGNSITCYPHTDDWWGSNWGCGATTIDKDYCHLTIAAKGYSSYDITSMRNWEFSNTRNKELSELDKVIKNYQYNIVVIELGENAKGRSAHFKQDLIDMVKYIKTYSPNARIVFMDNFWKFDDIIAAKKAAASEVGATYVSLSELWGVKDYQLQSGEVYDFDGVPESGDEYTINDFLAGHPNDAGFAAMAQKLISAL